MKTIAKILSVVCFIFLTINANSQDLDNISSVFIGETSVAGLVRLNTQASGSKSLIGGKIFTNEEGETVSVSADGTITVKTKGNVTKVDCKNGDGSITKIVYTVDPDGSYTVQTNTTDALGGSTSTTEKYDKTGTLIEK
jgi:hypothetical protein